MAGRKVGADRHRNIISARLKEARNRCNPPMTQDQLAGRVARYDVFVDRVAITKIESGIRCVYDFEVRAFAKVLKVDVAWLLEGDR